MIPSPCSLIRSLGAKVSIPSLTLFASCISTPLVTVLSSWHMLPKSSKQTQCSQPLMPSTDAVGKVDKIMVLGEKMKKKKTYRAKQKSFAIQVLPQRLGIHSISLSSLVLLGSYCNHPTGRGLAAPITTQIFIPWGWISPRLAPRHT